MRLPDISDIPVAQIMQRWPRTIPVFLRAQLYCVGCPIGGFHTISDAAREHGIPADEFEAFLLSEIAKYEVT